MGCVQKKLRGNSKCMWNGSKISTVDEDIEALLSRIEQSHHAVKRRGNDAGPGFSLIPRASPRSQPVEGTNTNISITPDATPRSVTTSRSQTFGEHTGSTLGVSQALNTFIPKIENIRECLQFSLNDQYRNLEKKFERLESLMVEQKSSFTESYDSCFHGYQCFSQEQEGQERPHSNALISSGKYGGTQVNFLRRAIDQE